MLDSADPLDGWNLNHISRISCGPASNDIYGKLFNRLKNLLSSFKTQIMSRTIGFEFFNLDASDLPWHLGNRTFARIEVRFQRE